MNYLDRFSPCGYLMALFALVVGQGTAQAADVPAVGTIITNVQRRLQENGTERVETNRYRVTGELIRRTAQADDYRKPEHHVIDPSVGAADTIMWPAVNNTDSVGTLMRDLPPLVLVTRQRGFMLFKGPSSRPDLIPDNLKRFFVQASSLLGFWGHGMRSTPEPGRGKWTCVAPVDHPGVKVGRVGPDPNNPGDMRTGIFSVDIDLLSGVTTNIEGGFPDDLIGSYFIMDGRDLVVSIATSRDEFHDGRATVLSSWTPASQSARGVFYENESTAIDVFINEWGAAHISVFRADIYNIAWGAEFVPVELLPNAPPSVTLTGRMVSTGFEVSFAPVVPAAAQLESSATLPGTWSPVQDVPAGSASVIIEAAKLPSASTFFRLSAKP